MKSKAIFLMKKFIIIFTLRDIIIVSNTQVYGKFEKFMGKMYEVFCLLCVKNIQFLNHVSNHYILCPEQIEIYYDHKVQTTKNMRLYELKLIIVVCWSKYLLDFDCLPFITTIIPFQV